MGAGLGQRLAQQPANQAVPGFESDSGQPTKNLVPT